MIRRKKGEISKIDENFLGDDGDDDSEEWGDGNWTDASDEWDCPNCGGLNGLARTECYNCHFSNLDGDDSNPNFPETTSESVLDAITKQSYGGNPMRNFMEATNILFKAPMLAEDLGTLSEIDPRILKAFKDTFDNYKIGRESPVFTAEISKATKALELFKDNKVIMFVLVTPEGHQIAAFSRAQKYRYDSPSISYWIDESWVFSEAEEKNLADAKLVTDLHHWRFTKAGTITDSGFYPLLTTVIKFAKAASGSSVAPTAIVVQSDEQRKELQAKRAATRFGAVYDPTKKVDFSSHTYIKLARNALQQRLTAYKMSKADSVASPEQLLDKVISDGYLDFITVNGFSYRLRDDRINLRSLKGDDSFYGDAYIEYQVDDSTPAYKELQRKLYSLDNREEEQKFREEVFPPSAIKIILELRGGVITPTKVKVERRGY